MLAGQSFRLFVLATFCRRVVVKGIDLGKALGGPIATNPRGSIGDVTFRQVRGETIISEKSSPGNHQTALALKAKNRFKQAANTWADVPGPAREILGLMGQRSGRNAYQVFSRIFLSAWYGRTIGAYNPTWLSNSISLEFEVLFDLLLAWNSQTKFPDGDGYFYIMIQGFNAAEERVDFTWQRVGDNPSQDFINLPTSAIVVVVGSNGVDSGDFSETTRPFAFTYGI